MPQRTKVDSATLQQLKDFYRLSVTEEIQEAYDDGELVLETSLFSDPGEDYSALYIGNRQIKYWPGY